MRIHGTVGPLPPGSRAARARHTYLNIDGCSWVVFEFVFCFIILYRRGPSTKPSVPSSGDSSRLAGRGPDTPLLLEPFSPLLHDISKTNKTLPKTMAKFLQNVGLILISTWPKSSFPSPCKISWTGGSPFNAPRAVCLTWAAVACAWPELRSGDASLAASIRSRSHAALNCQLQLQRQNLTQFHPPPDSPRPMSHICFVRRGTRRGRGVLHAILQILSLTVTLLHNPHPQSPPTPPPSDLSSNPSHTHTHTDTHRASTHPHP